MDESSINTTMSNKGQKPNVSITFLLLYFTLALAIFIFTRYYIKKRRMDKMVAKIPGPPTLPFIGNAHMFYGLDLEGMFKKQNEFGKIYGTVARYWFGPTILVISLCEPHYIEAVLTSEFATNKDPMYRFFKNVIGGIFVASGEKWKNTRKITNPTFNQKLLEQFVDVFNEQSKILVSILEKEVDGPEFDIHKYVAHCTLDIICGTQMGVNTTEQLYQTSDVSKNISEAVGIVKKRIFNIHLHPNIFYRLSKLYKQSDKCQRSLQEFINRILQKRKLARKEERTSPDRVIANEVKKRTIFIDAILDHYGHLADDDLIEEIMAMVVAGSDTTSVGISYAFMLMGRHNDVQDKVYKEITDVIGDNDEDIKYTDLPKLKYLDMVIKEVLRLFTIPEILRKLDKDQVICDMTLPAGSTILISIYMIHRDSRYWTNPYEFYPEHFLPENVAKRPKYSYIPFSMGPRSCPGGTFGMMSMKTVVASVIRKYRVTSSFDMKKVKYRNLFMKEPRSGYPLQLTKR